MTRVLIVTHSEEHELVDVVTRKLRERGAQVVRLDTDLFPTAVPLATWYGPEGERFVLRTPDGEVDLGAVSAVWNRRFYTARALPDDLDPQLRRPSVEESRRSLSGMIACLDAFQLDPLEPAATARHKPLQLKLARQLGLELPRTLTTNDPEALRAFYDACGGRVVTKMMTSFAVHDEEGRESVVFTNPVGEDDVADPQGLDLCPMTFQETVAKQLELRVTVLGHRVFAAAIDSQASRRARHDWRRDGVAMLDRWRPYELPAEVRDRLLALCDRLRLNYGAADLVLTPDGRFVFLELNPVGELYWLEKHADLPLTDALVDLLVEPSSRRLA